MGTSMWSTDILKNELLADKANASDYKPKQVTKARPTPVLLVQKDPVPLAVTSQPKIEMVEAGPRPEGLTAIEVLKSAWPEVNHLGGMQNLLMSWCQDKDFEMADVSRLCGGNIWGEAVRQLLLRANNTASGQTVNQVSRDMACGRAKGYARYSGSPEQDVRIRRANGASRELIASGSFAGAGAASLFSVSLGVGPIHDVPIAVVGQGAAGIMAMRALHQIGFTKVTAFEMRQEKLGIWANKNVYERSRNNPRQVSFLANGLAPAPGNGTEVRTFLANLANGYSTALTKQQSVVTEILPGNLGTQLRVGQELLRFPIVINCTGLGPPVPLADPDRMTTVSSNAQAGHRWQRSLTKEEMDGRRYIFTGLGNSTAEMLRQAHEAQDAGKELDYRVLTHYPREAVFDPDSEVESGGRRFRVFRDVSVPNLVDFQGDLAASRYDYFRALNSGRIVPDVRAWNVIGPAMAVSVGPRRRLMSFGFDEVYTLTGYRRTPADLEKMGIDYRPSAPCPRYDYDGEFQRPRRDPAGRVYKGYFGFGAVLDAPHNRNAIVIPGMAAQIGDLLMTLIVRAAEYKRRTR